uniref:Uncharacterized protein n=1 Tax=Anguilla anguilla TaxID=7936 RepID=A0A0E9TYK1_ANGAN
MFGKRSSIVGSWASWASVFAASTKNSTAMATGSFIFAV